MTTYKPPCIVCGGEGCASPRFVVTSGGTYVGSVDFAAALRQLEIERDEANAEIVQYKEERLRLRAEVSRLKRKIEDAPCLAARDGEMTYECRVDNLCRVCRWRSESLED